MHPQFRDRGNPRRALGRRPRVRELASAWASVDGIAIHTSVGGLSRNGPPVVLIHGMGASSRSLLPLATVLSRNFPTYVPDLPGSGRSERPPHVLDFAALGRALYHWLDTLELERACFVATSTGCHVAVELALAAPERIDRLVLLGPTLDPRWRTLGEQVPRWLLEALRSPSGLLSIAARDVLKFGPRRIVHAVRLALADRLEEKLPQVLAPTLVVRGQHDALVSQGWAERAVRLLPSGRLVVLPSAPHAVHFASPERVASVVRPFIRGDTRPSEAAQR